MIKIEQIDFAGTCFATSSLLFPISINSFWTYVFRTSCSIRFKGSWTSKNSLMNNCFLFRDLIELQILVYFSANNNLNFSIYNRVRYWIFQSIIWFSKFFWFWNYISSFCFSVKLKITKLIFRLERLFILKSKVCFFVLTAYLCIAVSV